MGFKQEKIKARLLTLHLSGLLTLGVSSLSALAVAKEFVETPTDSMPTYFTYREELLNKGWLPVPQNLGIRSEIPEVVCGASGRLCTAHWLYSELVENRELKIILWETERGLVVAPYVE